MTIRTIAPLGPNVVYAPPAFKRQHRAPKARFAHVEARLRQRQTVECPHWDYENPNPDCNCGKR